MKTVLLCFSLLLSAVPLLGQNFTAAPDVPTAALNPDFPVHIHIFQSHWNYVRGAYEGYGRADLLGDKPTGLDYTYSCSEPFLRNAQHEEFYQGRWKKQDEKLEIVMQKVGSDHQQKCELKVALKMSPYGRYGAPGTPANSAQPAPPAGPQMRQQMR